MNSIRIGKSILGDGHPLYFIADIAANHDGNIDRAYRLIELAKEAGASAAKFQNFQASKIVSKVGFESLGGQLSHQKSWKKSVYEIYEDASISYDWTALLKAKCDEVGIDYFTSPYDFKSVDQVDPYVEVYKIGSGDITWPEII
jgi:N-acetylneuraminate synthase